MQAQLQSLGGGDPLEKEAKGFLLWESLHPVGDRRSSHSFQNYLLSFLTLPHLLPIPGNFKSWFSGMIFLKLLP
jgi:hypothetical protein